MKRDGVTLWFALGHPATPWPVKAIAAVVVAYALSPIDLIPDFVPVLVYVDDVLLVSSVWAFLAWLCGADGQAGALGPVPDAPGCARARGGLGALRTLRAFALSDASRSAAVLG